ncbi:MAG: hypothetical protein O7J95_01885 [Planctomycetota bacterium]|nr:hypothetical protein [Planctomycetota bacterium]
MQPDAFFLFATQLATGVSGVLCLVPLQRIGRRFFVLMSLVALVFLTLALVSRGVETGYAHVACAAFLIGYNVVLPRQASDPGPRGTSSKTGPTRLALGAAFVLLLCATASGVVGQSLAASDFGSEAERLPPALVASAFVSSSALLGAALVAMVLGHWYLVARGLSFAPLRRLTGVLALALIVRLALSAATLSLQRPVWARMMDEMGASGFFLADGIFVIARIVVGLLAPLILVKLVWDCLKVESNQSATGILYVIVAFVLIGELLAKHYLASGLIL